MTTTYHLVIGNTPACQYPLALLRGEKCGHATKRPASRAAIRLMAFGVDAHVQDGPCPHSHPAANGKSIATAARTIEGRASQLEADRNARAHHPAA